MALLRLQKRFLKWNLVPEVLWRITLGKLSPFQAGWSKRHRFWLFLDVLPQQDKAPGLKTINFKHGEPDFSMRHWLPLVYKKAFLTNRLPAAIKGSPYVKMTCLSLFHRRYKTWNTIKCPNIFKIEKCIKLNLESKKWLRRSVLQLRFLWVIPGQLHNAFVNNSTVGLLTPVCTSENSQYLSH